MILTKGEPEEGVWFYEVSEDGFQKTSSIKGRPPSLDKEDDLVRLRRIWNEKPDSERSFSVPLNQIRENSYKLSLSSYRARSKKPDWLQLGGKEGVCRIVLGGTPKTDITEYWRNGTHLWVTITDMVDRYITKTGRMITKSGIENSNAKLVPKGTGAERWAYFTRISISPNSSFRP